MALPSREQKYSPIKAEHADIEDQEDSDTTLTSAEFLGKRSKRRRRHFQKSIIPFALTWFRWGSIIILQIVILILMLRNTTNNTNTNTSSSQSKEWKAEDTETGGDVNGLYVPSECILILEHNHANIMPLSISQIHIAGAK